MRQSQANATPAASQSAQNPELANEVDGNGDVTMIDTGAAAAQNQSSQITESNEGSRVPVSQERFLLNTAFKSNLFRLNLPIPALEEDGSSTKKEKVEQNRAHSIDATIVK